MGINISVIKVIEKTMEEGWHNNLVPYYAIRKQKWFDHLRFGGDSDFVTENEFYYYDDSDEEGKSYRRPSDFDKCRCWVKSNIIEENQKRLLNALDKIEADETLCFTWSW